MNIISVEEYQKSVIEYANSNVNWNLLKNKSFLISGATGMIGKCLIDIIMYKNKTENLNCKIIAVGRNEEKARERFDEYYDNKYFKFVENDINRIINVEDDVDYILHAASSTHPLQYSNDPIGTITANVIGTYNLLEFGAVKNIDRFIFSSSVEIYGENKGDADKFSEDYLGYINCNTLRAGYPESKRTGEALCNAFIKQKNMDIVIARFSRLFGPTMLMSDSKASSQFIKNSIEKNDIILKSNGLQEYSYAYVFDAVIGLMTILTKGKKGEAYNISDDKFNIKLRDFAKICANINGKEVIFDIPDDTEKAGYSVVTKALMDSKKINELGWNAESDIETRIEDTVKILRKKR